MSAKSSNSMEYVEFLDKVKNNKKNISHVEEVSPGLAFVIRGYSGGGKIHNHEISDARNTLAQVSRREKIASRLRGKLCVKALTSQ